MLLVSLALAGPATAQEWARKMFETTSHDFGAVARGAKVEYRFKLNNIYEEDVHITGVRSSCGCTMPTIAKDSLKTYEEGAIVAAFNTHSFLGQRHATVTVTFDKPFYAEVQLSVSGYIRSDIVMTPGSAEFGNVDFGTKAEKKLSVTYAGRDDWKILEVKPNNAHVLAAVKEMSRGAGQVVYELTVDLKSDAPRGYFKDQVTLVTNDQNASLVPVDVEARVVAEVTISPTSLFLGVLKPGQKITKQLVVQGKKPFKISAVSCDAEGFEFKPSDTSKTVHVIPVTFTAGTKPVKFSKRIKIESDLGPGVIPEILAYVQVLAPEPIKAADNR
jgi:hypothetical protein